MESLWEKLSNDLKAEIICRLPERNMIKLKLVSKDWCFFISSICIPRISPPSQSSTFCGFIFRQMYCETSRRVVRFAGYGSYRRFSHRQRFQERYYAKLPFQLNPEDVQDCCNGFILLLHGGVYYVCNPTTLQCIQIPLNPEQQDSRESFASLAFDPTKSLDFKIITTHASIITNPLKLETFSSDTCEWSSQLVPVDEKLNGIEWIKRSVYLNGVVYRMLMGKYLLCIDLSTKIVDLKVRAIELPKEDEIETNGAIGTSRGCLYYSNNDSSRLLVWMLNDGVEWILRHCVAIDDLWAHLKEGLGRFVDIRHFVDKYRGSDCFKFYAFHPNRDEIFLVTPMVIMGYHFGNKCFDLSLLLLGKEILPGQNCILPFSRCSIVLKSLEQRSLLPAGQLIGKIREDDLLTGNYRSDYSLIADFPTWYQYQKKGKRTTYMKKLEPIGDNESLIPGWSIDQSQYLNPGHALSLEQLMVGKCV